MREEIRKAGLRFAFGLKATARCRAPRFGGSAYGHERAWPGKKPLVIGREASHGAAIEVTLRHQYLLRSTHAEPPFGAARERGLVAVATVYSRLLCIVAFYWPWPQFALTVRGRGLVIG